MAWVTWRLHRGQAAACIGLIAVVCLALLALGVPMHDAWAHGPAGCAATGGGDCAATLSDFQARFTGPLEQLLGWLNLLPALIGAFVGAPLLAREFETGTWRLAFTQAVPRSRWLTAKIGLLGLAILLPTIGLAAVFGWYRAPLDVLEGRFGPNSYDFEGLSLPALTLFAFAVGVLCGVLIRRTLAAMAVTIGVFLLVRVPVETWLRPHLQPPITVTGAAASSAAGRSDWILAQGLADASGHHLSGVAETQVMHAAHNASGPIQAYLSAHGYTYWATIQPASRFWHFQLVEATFYIALALAAATAAVLTLRRHPR